MQFFGLSFDVKKAPRGESSKKKAFTYQVSPINGTIVDGEKIARNLRTYFLMYRRNSDLRRCIEEICQTAMKSGYETRKSLSDGRKKTVVDQRIEDALFYGGSSPRVLKNQILQSLIVSGTAFVRKRRNIRGGLIGFEVLDTRYVTVYADTDLTPIRYTYQNPAKKSAAIEEYPADDIKRYVATLDPDNPLFGLTPLEALVPDIMGDEEASLSNYFFFANDATPSSLYVLEDGLDEEQQKAVFEQIKDTLSGGHNKHKNIVSSNVKDIKPTRVSHTDADFLEQRKFTTERVCAALGVPKIILSYTDGVNYSSSETQYKKFIENTIRPWERLIEEILTDLISGISEGIEFAVIDEHIDDLEQRSKLARDNVLAGLWTRNEARDYVGYDKDTANEMMDEFTVPSTQVPIDSLAATEPTVPPEEIPAAA